MTRQTSSARAIYVTSFLVTQVITTALWFSGALLGGRSVAAALVGAGFAGVFAPVVLSATMVRRFGSLQGDSLLRPVVTRIVAGPYDAAFDRCAEAVRSLGGSTVEQLDRTSGTVSARVARTPESWGERVVVSLRELNSETEITVSSHPRMALTVIDQGKNQRNVEHILTNLRAAGVG